MSYSTDLRERVIKFIDGGGSKTEAGRIFSVSRFTVYYWLHKKAVTGTVKDAAPKRGWKKLEPKALEAYVKEHSDSTLAEYAAYFGASIPSVCLALKRLKITRKKRLLSIKNEMKKSVQHFWSK